MSLSKSGHLHKDFLDTKIVVLIKKKINNMPSTGDSLL
jgi:hypothetical protein